MNTAGQIGTAAKAIVAQAHRLGLTWKLRPATIIDASSTTPTVILDGDSAAIPAMSLVGFVPATARVMIMIVPPSGLYIIGYVKQSPLIQVQSNTKTAPFALTTVKTDFADTLVTITTAYPNATFDAIGMFDFNGTVAGYGLAIGYLAVDGVSLSGNAVFALGALRDTASEVWTGVLADAGTHTFVLQAHKNINAGTVTAMEVHTRLRVTVYESPLTMS